MSSGIPVVPLEGEGAPGNLLLAPYAGRLAGGQRKERPHPPPQLWQEEFSVTVNLQEVLSPCPLEDHPHWSYRFFRAAPGHRLGPRSTPCDMGLGAPEPAPGSIQRPPLSLRSVLAVGVALTVIPEGLRLMRV